MEMGGSGAHHQIRGCESEIQRDQSTRWESWSIMAGAGKWAQRKYIIEESYTL